MFAHNEGGRGRGALHSPATGPDRAALQAGGKSGSERISVPAEVLPSRAWVRVPSLPFSSSLSRTLNLPFEDEALGFCDSLRDP